MSAAFVFRIGRLDAQFTITPRIVWPLRELSSMSAELFPPVKRDGVVFYVYSWDFCESRNRYIEQLKLNIDSIHDKDPNVRESPWTECVGQHCACDVL